MCSSNSSSSSTPLYSGWVASIKNKNGEKETEGALDLSPWVFHAGLCAALCTRRLSSWQHRGVRVVRPINMKGKTLNHCFILSFSLWWEGGGGGLLWICRCPCGGAKPLASRDFLAPCLERGHALRSAPLPATPAHPPQTENSVLRELKNGFFFLFDVPSLSLCGWTRLSTHDWSSARWQKMIVFTGLIALNDRAGWAAVRLRMSQKCVLT